MKPRFVLSPVWERKSHIEGLVVKRIKWSGEWSGVYEYARWRAGDGRLYSAIYPVAKNV